MENRQNGRKNGRTEILLLGCNSWKDGKYEHSDSMIIVSIDRKTGTIKLASILRDIRVDFHEYGMDKINAAIVYGGPEFSVQVINEIFHRDIRYYAVVDMYGLVNIIDLLGGIDVEITEIERIFLNCWVRDLAMQFKDGIIPPHMEKAGLVRMDGRMALSHARNRTIGTDFTRSNRQRTVLMAMARKIKEETGWSQRIKLFFRGRKYVKTNLPVTQIAALGIPVLKALKADVPSLIIPAENTYTVCRDENWHFDIDFEENARELEKFFAG